MMFSKQKTDWNLLARFMAGEATDVEMAEVMKWAANSSENQVLLNEIKSDWKKMDRMEVRFNVDNAWNKVHNRIAPLGEQMTDSHKVNPQLVYSKRFLTPMRIAASLLLLALLGASLVFITGRFQEVNVTAEHNERDKAITLPDGSLVYLNANASLTYPRHFNKKSREVSLTGEAFFEVTPDKSKPFSIIAGNARIKVLGTSFSVNTRKGNNQVEVYVATGIVELSEADNQQNRVLLHPGNIGVFNNRSVTSSKANNANCIAWKTRDMTFEDTRLADVTDLLNEVYNVNIVILTPGMDTTRINGAYQDDPLDSILKVICTHNLLTLAKSADTIYLAR